MPRHGAERSPLAWRPGSAPSRGQGLAEVLAAQDPMLIHRAGELVTGNSSWTMSLTLVRLNHC